jgi:hypothetical protein
MSIRWFIGGVGVLAIIAGLVFLLLPISLQDSTGETVGCGAAMGSFSNNDVAASAYALHQEERRLTGNPYDPPATAPNCGNAVAQRRMWAIPVAVVGLVVIVGAAVVRMETKPSWMAPGDIFNTCGSAMWGGLRSRGLRVRHEVAGVMSVGAFEQVALCGTRLRRAPTGLGVVR